MKRKLESDVKNLIKIPTIFKGRNRSQKHGTINYNSQGFHIVADKRSNEKNAKLVTVITPVYNSEKYLRKTIESVINQSLGMDKMEYILVDDGSTDSSREILLDYSSRFPSIIAVFFKKNSGTPGRPRNIGMQLSNSKYITFLDADDWLHQNGLETLATILEETGDDYAVGKTIQVKRNGTSVIGEHESCKERRSVEPCSIPHIFHHVGPRARMIRTDMMKDNNILFPEMKFAEDKQFFIEILTHCQTMSTTKNPIYYLNRIDNQKTRLSNQTNILQKANCNLKVINHILNKDLELETQKMALNRLYEFDSISRFFTTPHFQKTKLKHVYYYKLNQVLKTTKKLGYEFSNEFHQPLNKEVYQLFNAKKYKELESLYEWERTEKVKEVLIKDDLPYMAAPTLEGENRHIRVPMHAIYIEDSLSQNKYCLQFNVYGDHRDSITDVLIRNTNNALQEATVPVSVDKGGHGIVEIDLELLNQLSPATYSIFLRYNDYMKINFRKHNQSTIKHQYQNHEFIFHNTIYSNVGLKILPAQKESCTEKAVT